MLPEGTENWYLVPLLKGGATEGQFLRRIICSCAALAVSITGLCSRPPDNLCARL